MTATEQGNRQKAGREAIDESADHGVGVFGEVLDEMAGVKGHLYNFL